MTEKSAVGECVVKEREERERENRYIDNFHDEAREGEMLLAVAVCITPTYYIEGCLFAAAKACLKWSCGS